MNIGVIRFSSLGDIVLTTPAVRMLAETFPGASINYITSTAYADLANLIPGVSKVVAIDKESSLFNKSLEHPGESEWDLIADLQGSPRSGIVRRKLNPGNFIVDKPPRFRRSLLIMFKMKIGKFYDVPTRQLNRIRDWGVKDDGLGLELAENEEVKSGVENRWPLLRENPFVFIPGAKHETKKWPGDKWLDLYEKLKEKGPVVTIGTKGEMPAELKSLSGSHAEFLDLTGRTDIPETLEIIRLSRCIICGDTGPMHLAVAAKKPLVALFGPTVKEFGFYPFRSETTEVIERKLWCRPCSAHGGRKCPLGHLKCLKQISADEVAGSVFELIGN